MTGQESLRKSCLPATIFIISCITIFLIIITTSTICNTQPIYEMKFTL